MLLLQNTELSAPLLGPKTTETDKARHSIVPLVFKVTQLAQTPNNLVLPVEVPIYPH